MELGYVATADITLGASEPWLSRLRREMGMYLLGSLSMWRMVESCAVFWQAITRFSCRLYTYSPLPTATNMFWGGSGETSEIGIKLVFTIVDFLPLCDTGKPLLPSWSSDRNDSPALCRPQCQSHQGRLSTPSKQRKALHRAAQLCLGALWRSELQAWGLLPGPCSRRYRGACSLGFRRTRYPWGFAQLLLSGNGVKRTPTAHLKPINNPRSRCGSGTSWRSSEGLKEKF